MKRLCLDTNAYTALMRGDEVIRDLLERVESLFMPSVVLGELFAGFAQGSRQTWNTQLLDRFLGRPGCSIVRVDRAIAERYGRLVAVLRAQATPIPTNDLWISATAFEVGATLVTYDRHFDVVPMLPRTPE